jgi:hypothetical protein
MTDYDMLDDLKQWDFGGAGRAPER